MSTDPATPSSQESELVRLQRTLYNSSNPTRKWLHNSRYEWICEAIARYGSAGCSALEVGPGSGVYLSALSERCSSLTLVDIEREYLDGLAPLVENNDRISSRIDDITRSSFPDNGFDLVLCSEVIEHIPDSAAALGEIYRILKPGGILILSTPQPFSPLEQAAKVAFLPGIRQLVRLIYREPLLPLGHINLLSGRRLQAQLTAAGFTIIDRHTSGVYIPVLSEFFGELAVTLQKKLELMLRESRLKALLWTQYYVLRAMK